MSITVTKVNAEHNSYTGRYTIEVFEDFDSDLDLIDVDVADVPDRIREALIDWALGDPICEECAAENQAPNTEADTEDAPAPYTVDDLFRDFNARSSGKDPEEHAELDIFGDPIPRPTGIERYLTDLIRDVGQVIKDPQTQADFYKDVRLAWDRFKK